MGLTLALHMLLGMAGASHASSILYTGDGFNDANSGVTFAMEISPVANIPVSDLGVYDGGLDGPGLNRPAGSDWRFQTQEGRLIHGMMTAARLATEAHRKTRNIH
jgi:hypothetical protein